MPRAATKFDSADIIKGYEVGKGDYIELDPEELEAVAIESKRTIDIDEFVPKDEIDELYLNNPYYIAPDGEVGQQAFAVKGYARPRLAYIPLRLENPKIGRVDDAEIVGNRIAEDGPVFRHLHAQEMQNGSAEVVVARVASVVGHVAMHQPP